jgi:hypothetical protein
MGKRMLFPAAPDGEAARPDAARVQGSAVRQARFQEAHH